MLAFSSYYTAIILNLKHFMMLGLKPLIFNLGSIFQSYITKKLSKEDMVKMAIKYSSDFRISIATQNFGIITNPLCISINLSSPGMEELVTPFNRWKI